MFEGPRLVAEGLVFNGRYANCTVHPELEGRGLGTALLHWTQEVARAQGGSTVGGTVPDENAPARALFLANGYEPIWDSWILEIAHGEEPAEPRLPPGYEIRPCADGEGEAVHRVIEDAFSEWESRPPTPFEDWRAWALERPGFEPWMLPVVVGDGQIVGAALPHPVSGRHRMGAADRRPLGSSRTGPRTGAAPARVPRVLRSRTAHHGSVDGLADRRPHPVRARRDVGHPFLHALREGTRAASGGGRGIRTRERVAPLHALQACPFVRSGRPPRSSLAR